MNDNDVHSGDISLLTPSDEGTMEVDLSNFYDSDIILKRKHENNLVKGCKKRKLYQPRHRCDKIGDHINSNVCDNKDTSINNENQNLVQIFEELKEELNNVVTCAVDKVIQNFKNKYKHLINNKVHNTQLNTDVIQKSPTDLFSNLNVQFPYLLHNSYNKFNSNNIINYCEPEVKHNPDINSNNFDRLSLEHNINGNRENKTTFPLLKTYIKEYSTLFNNNIPPFDKDISGKSAESFQHENCHQKSVTIKEDNNKVGFANSICLHKVHLRKAKLMFFWVRYPSSAVLKTYFPGIKFTKNNTGQLVKWFSNFREYFYKSIETYTRKVITETEIISKDDAFKINRNSELFRTLNIHYNYNNAVVPPQEFLDVVERTVKEFYMAIQAEKTSEQSWKKSVYKVVARLDKVVPEHFKETDFLEKLK